MTCTLPAWSKEYGITSKDQKWFPLGKGCIFCNSSAVDEATFGEYIHHSHTGLKMHYFCLVLSSGLVQTINEESSNTYEEPNHVYGFEIKNILQEVKRAFKLTCSYCKNRGATIGCVVKQCKKKMHHPCIVSSSKALSRFYGNFSTWCETHRPTPDVYQRLPFYKQRKPGVLKELRNGVAQKFAITKSEEKQDNNGAIDIQTCFACLEEIQSPFDESEVIVSSCCLNFFSHKSCLQRHASSCGLHFFRCPGCNNTEEFQKHMLLMGIYIPDRDASWEVEGDAYSELLVRYSKCDREECVCPHGRE